DWTGAPPVHARGEGLCESRMREIRTSGSTRGEERCPPPLLLYHPPGAKFLLHFALDTRTEKC
ncbi:MAG: hypothetical protein ABSH01_05500, partial [Terriglobia bacterium]